MKLTGEILKEQREILGFSKKEMAERSGLSRPTIIDYETKEGLAYIIRKSTKITI